MPYITIVRFAPCPRSGRALCALLFPRFLRWCSPWSLWCGVACVAVEALSYLCHSCFPSIPQAVPTEAASERRGEAPTEAQLHSARLTGEADLTKAINIYIFLPQHQKNQCNLIIQVIIGSTKIYMLSLLSKCPRFLAWNYYGRSGQDFQWIHLPPWQGLISSLRDHHHHSRSMCRYDLSPVLLDTVR